MLLAPLPAFPATMLSFYDRRFSAMHIPEGRPAHYALPDKNVHCRKNAVSSAGDEERCTQRLI
jgi:hypothetical protein